MFRFCDRRSCKTKDVNRIKEHVWKRHTRHIQMLGCRKSDSSDLFTSNGGRYVFFEHRIADSIFFERVSRKRHCCHNQELGYRNLDSSDLFTSNGSGWGVRFCDRRCCKHKNVKTNQEQVWETSCSFLFGGRLPSRRASDG